IFCGLTVISQGAEARRNFSGISSDHSRVTVRAEIFCRVEAQTCGVAKAADVASLVRCANSLCAVFDEWELVRLREGRDRVHVRGEAVEMDGDDSASSRSDAAV